MSDSLEVERRVVTPRRAVVRKRREGAEGGGGKRREGAEGSPGGGKRPRLGDRTNRLLLTPQTPRNARKTMASLASPSVEKMLSQDDSFFTELAGQLEEEERREETDSQADMFEDSGEEEEQEVVRRVKAEPSDWRKSETPVKAEVKASQDICSPPASLTPSLTSSLPASCLDVRARALEELARRRLHPPAPALPPPVQPATPWSRLVAEGRDVGPFHGLPSVVAELYRKHKKVTQLFPWQQRCLQARALREKSNLLYSLPTSGGKTMVAEIVMLQELVCYKRNVIFVLPFVSLVQEKVRALAPFALELGFHLQEYAGSRGSYPPKRRLHKKDLFICTIEKAHSLFNSLVTEGRRGEVGLIVVDEVHMLGEPGGRGANLEALLTKVLHLNRSLEQQERLQVVAMSATVGNLEELAAFLQAELFTDNFRPVELKEHLVVGRQVMEVRGSGASTVEERLVYARTVAEAAPEAKVLDEDGIAPLVLEVFPKHSVLVFCDSKRRCENVAELLVKVIRQTPELAERISAVEETGRAALLARLETETGGYVCPTLRRTVVLGVAYHHSGLTQDERKLVEEGFLSGVLGVLCCTSTLAAGVNLPARRVILRSPYMGRAALTHAQYKQMVGRAGRAGLDTHGESFLMLREDRRLAALTRDTVLAKVDPCLSSLHECAGRGLPSLLLNCLHLGLVTSPATIQAMLSCSLLSLQAGRLTSSLPSLVSAALQELLSRGLVSPALEATQSTQESILPTTVLQTSKLGRAVVSGNIDLGLAERLYRDLAEARPGLAVDTSLHLLFLVTPYDQAEQIAYQPAVFHDIYMELGAAELAVCRSLGVTEVVMVRLMCGGSVAKAVRPVLSRLYCALMLQTLWQAGAVHRVAQKFQVARGQVQSLMAGAAGFASCVLHFCQELEEFWAYQELLEPFARRLSSCCSPELLPLLELPGVQAGRAKQLHSAGFTTVAELAKARPGQLVQGVEHLSLKAAMAIIQGAKLVLTEKVENYNSQLSV